MKSNKEKCKVLHLGRNNPMHKCMLGATQLESSLVEKVMGVKMDVNLNMGQQRDLEATKISGIMSCIRRIVKAEGMPEGQVR